MQRKVLIVDDEPDHVQLVCFHLRQAGFSVATATDGIEGLEKAKSILPDLILLDLKLPEMNGFAVCESLRQDPATASIPVVMLTALSGQFGRLNAIVSGATDYITKPIRPADLVERVDSWISRSSRNARRRGER